MDNGYVTRYYHTRNIGYCMYKNLSPIKFLKWFLYYIFIFVTKRVIFYTVTLRFKTAVFILKGMVHFLIGNMEKIE